MLSASKFIVTSSGSSKNLLHMSKKFSFFVRHCKYYIVEYLDFIFFKECWIYVCILLTVLEVPPVTVGASSHASKNYRFDPQAGHVLGCAFDPQWGCMLGRQAGGDRGSPSMFLSPFLSQIPWTYPRGRIKEKKPRRCFIEKCDLITLTIQRCVPCNGDSGIYSQRNPWGGVLL